MLSKLHRIFLSWVAPKSPLKREAFYLRLAIQKTEAEVKQIFEMDFPSCCHYCAYPELHGLQDALEAKKTRLAYLERKLLPREENPKP